MATIDDGRFAVVTCGSSGIGLELAGQFLASQFDVMSVGDSPEVPDVARELHRETRLAEPGSGQKH